MTTSAADDPSHFRFRPCLTLQTWHRGDGLLGMVAHGLFGPRGAQVTMARVEWTYANDMGAFWACPAPVSVLSARATAAVDVLDAQGRIHVLHRDVVAESDALSVLRDTELRPLDSAHLQWRAAPLAAADTQANSLWSLPKEDDFADFWSEAVPSLKRAGWRVVVKPGFAHQSVPVTAWKLVLLPDAAAGAVAHEPVGDWLASTVVQPLAQPKREGSWLLSLGVEIDGQVLDLAPMIADLLKRDARWLDRQHLRHLSDDEIIRLKAPGGRRVEAPAGPLKAIVTHLIDVLTEPRRSSEPLRMEAWDALRLSKLQAQLEASLHARSVLQATWPMQDALDVKQLATRLMLAGTPPPVAVPGGLAVQLRPYQRQGLDWLQYLRTHGLAGILADDMGLGKTAQALAHILVEKESGRLALPAMVVVPTSLVFNWQAEAQRMAPSLKVLTWHGEQRHHLSHQIGACDVLLVTYPLVWRDVGELSQHAFHLLILDEAQTVKNALSRTALAVRQLKAQHRLCLTGTPLENHLGELWAQFDFLMPGYLGDRKSFQRQWRDPIEKNGESVRADLLAQRVRPFVLRRRKADVALELPPKVEVMQLLELEGRQKDLYESVRVAADEQVRKAIQKHGFAGAHISILDALLKLRQVCCDPYLLKGISLSKNTPRAKMNWLMETVPNLVSQGRRILIFSQFVTMLDLVSHELNQHEVSHLMLSGQTASSKRGALVERFQSKEAEAVFLVSLKAGGVGLNLTAADTVIHLDPWWNPAVEAQASDRAHRLGQANQVMVYKLMIAGSIEARMSALKARKSDLAEMVLGGDQPDALKFSEEDLSGLLAPLHHLNA